MPGLASAAGLGGLGGGVVGAVNWVTQRRRRRQDAAARSPVPSEATTTEVPAPDVATTAAPTAAPTAEAATTTTPVADTPASTGSTAPPAGTSTAPAQETGRQAGAEESGAERGTSARGVAGATAAAGAAGVAAAGVAAASSRTTGPDRAGSSKDEPTTPAPARDEPARQEPARQEPAREEPAREEPAREEAARDEPPRGEPASTTTTTPASASAAPEPSVGPTVPSTPAPDPAAAEAEAAWSARRERAQRRKRILLVVLVAVVAVLLVWAIPWLVSSIGSLVGGGEPERPAVITPAAPPPKPELPRGGTTIFPNYRVVAYYGTPGNPNMGVLGDGPPEPMAQQLEKAALAFTTPNRVVQPTMELIVHVADGAPGDDGDYSHAIDEQKAWQYLAVARAHRQLLVIDIQPGSSDFLSTTKPWERLLREPDVGLALDPEWRMPPGQVPGKSIGTVTSAEVNETAQWLAGIVREANLPQKLFVVHQFTPNMITEPEKLITPPELAVVGHVDGFGGPADKLAKYRALVRPGRLHPGFKLFYTQDTPMLSPEQTLGLNPAPDFVTYQ